MHTPLKGSVTQLLAAVREGDRSALNALFPLVYDQLHALAHRKRLDWEGDYTLNTTALVHEAYLKLVDQSNVEWQSRAHFFRVAAKAMRHILINYAQRRQAQKRGGAARKVSFDEMRMSFDAIDTTIRFEHVEMLTVLDAALTELEAVDTRQSSIVECRFYGGMTVEETATALGVSAPTVKRGWAMAQAWLYRKMAQHYDA